MPLISIIVPVYNAEGYLDRCLASIQAQTCGDFEVLLVDDGSRDRSGDICERWAGKDSRFRVIHQENSGQSVARNTGLQHCSGAYLSFVDADDYLEPGYLEYLLALLRRSSRCRVAQANHYIDRETGRRRNDDREEDLVLMQEEAAKAVLFHDRVDVSAWGKLYYRSVFEHLRFPPGKVFEDTAVFGEVLLATEEYVYGHLPQYHYVMHPESTVHRPFSRRNLEYLEATERLTGGLVAKYPELHAGCVRRQNQARMSVLRYMQRCEGEDLLLRDRLRKTVLEQAGEYLPLAETPRRDRVAIALLRMGWTPFYQGWAAYQQLQKWTGHERD